MDRFIVRTKRKSEENYASKRVKRHVSESSNSNGSAVSETMVHGESDNTANTGIIQKQEWTKLSAENLDCDYTILYSKTEADTILKCCEEELEYYSGQLAQVQIFGQWHNIPRKQTAHGDTGLTYTFSGKTLPAKPWTPLLDSIRNRIAAATGCKFNFVLINRYKDGQDHIGEHRDDEKDLVKKSPIASLSLGQERDFVFKHRDARGSKATRQIPTLSKRLEHGSLLVMNFPTNQFWYHSVPVRKSAPGFRINMTFRDFVVKNK